MANGAKKAAATRRASAKTAAAGRRKSEKRKAVARGSKLQKAVHAPSKAKRLKKGLKSAQKMGKAAGSAALRGTTMGLFGKAEKMNRNFAARTGMPKPKMPKLKAHTKESLEHLSESEWAKLRRRKP